MKSAAIKDAPSIEAPVSKPKSPRTRRKMQDGRTMIGAIFDWEVRRGLTMVNLEPENQGRTLTDLLGEAINDLCVKYGQKPPYRPESEEEQD